jgi:hypothetical protein
VIFVAGLLVGIVLTSIAWLLIVGLCLSAKERDVREELSYPELEVSASEGFTLTDCAVNGAPLPPSWVNDDGDAA